MNRAAVRDIFLWIWFLAVPPALAARPGSLHDQRPPMAGGDANATRLTDIHDIKPALAISSGLQWLYWALALAAILGLAFLAWRLWQKRRKQAPPGIATVPIPAETEAFQMLEALAADGHLNSKQFYFRLSAIVRRYIERRYEIPAAEMTTEELLPVADRLPLTGELAQDLKAFCRTADPIKFAGVAADPGRMAHDMAFARNFVHKTTEMVKSAAEVDLEAGPSDALTGTALKLSPSKGMAEFSNRRPGD